MIRTEDLKKVEEEKRDETIAKAVMRVRFTYCQQNDDLYGALRPMIISNFSSLPVVSDSESMTLVGIVTRREIGRFVKNVTPESA